jgi:hypothetical protein
LYFTAATNCGFITSHLPEFDALELQEYECNVARENSSGVRSGVYVFALCSA